VLVHISSTGGRKNANEKIYFKKEILKMFTELFGRLGGGCGCGCGCGEVKPCVKNSSCDVLWIIVLLMVVFKGGLFGIDICTLIILFIVFGKDILCMKKHEHKC
jgi:hypothetical protein